MQFLLLLAFAIGLGAANDVSYSNFDMALTMNMYTSYDHYRLPTAVRPESYTLQIVTHLEDPNDLRFGGEVAILLKVLEDTKNITLHAQNLTIDSSMITLKPTRHRGRPNCVSSTQLNPHHDYYIIHLCEAVHRGEEYVLTMPFGAMLNPKLHGYYKSSYFDKAGNETRWLAVTQFEPAFARAAFPCFDEPDFKAKFTVILGHHKKYNALSNMPLKEARPFVEDQEWVWSEFEESVPMSTYLVAYSINDFDYKTSPTNLKNNVRFRTWSRPEAIGQCDYAGMVGPAVLEYYEDIFDIKFPLPKIDQIAIPDFGAGAMENWGLVTYRETALLWAENVSSMASKQRVASVVAHELAHQWFGNLVTMKWWTDLWLNEGFATYVASLGLEHISPEWKSLEEESVDNMLVIFRLDALKSSHPISQPIHHASEIFEIFDSISYKKGSTVLRMMHNFMGDQAFRAGITNYLMEHAYGNAEQDNLWSALTTTAHKNRAVPQHVNIKTIMDSWTLQTGYPIITVTRDYAKKTATVTQVRYLLDTQVSRQDSRNCWWIPLSYTDQAQANFKATNPKAWLECDEEGGVVPQTIEDMPKENEWVLFNVQMTTLYKIKYDQHNWDLLIRTLMSPNYKRIHIINRAQLIDDALSLAWTGDQHYDVAMHLIEYLTREKEYIPWKAALDNLGYVNRILRRTPKYEYFKEYMRKILTPIYWHLHGLNETQLGKSTENHSSILHKVLIASWACRFEVEDCIPTAQAYFADWRSSENPDERNPIPSDLRTVVYCTAIREGGADDWNFLWARYKNSNVASEKKTIISALGCSRQIWLLQRFLDWSFDNTHIRKQDAFYAFGTVARSEAGFYLARDYFYSNIEFLHDFVHPDVSDLSHLLTPLSTQMINKVELDHLKAFVETNKKLLAKAEQGVRRALETVEINTQWKEAKYVEISRSLESSLRNLWTKTEPEYDEEILEENTKSQDD